MPFRCQSPETSYNVILDDTNQPSVSLGWDFRILETYWGAEEEGVSGRQTEHSIAAEERGRGPYSITP